MPATRTAPSAISRSLAARFERVGGDLLQIVGEPFAAPSTDAPPQGIELDPPVPVPVAIRSVSPWITRTRSGASAEMIGDDLRIGGVRGPARSTACRPAR